MTLFDVFIKKEVIFWKRTWGIRKKMNWFGTFIALIFLGMAHYAMTFMHTSLEMYLYIFNRNAFKRNMKKEENKIYELEKSLVQLA